MSAKTKTKIIATLGPASDSEIVLRKMYQGGLDVVRLNFSHGTHKDHNKRINLIRRLNQKLHRAVKIMQDLEGYRIRVGKLKAPLILRKRSQLYFTQEDIVGNESEVPFDYRGSLRAIKRGTLVHIDDGKITLQVKKVEKRRLRVSVVAAGVLKEHKGINIPDVRLEFSALTEKDKDDIKIAINFKLDYIAQSFVRSASDLMLIRNIILHKVQQIKLFAKVESREALQNIDEIIKAADGIIIARGDMGVCLPIYKVPVIQKEIIKKCRLAGKPVVVATQMLESMTEEILPTRAEVSDVANAILDGADFVMLSSETAVGKHPHKVVEMMNSIIRHTEAYQKRLKEWHA